MGNFNFGTIKHIFTRGWSTDPIAFVCEIIGAVFTIAGSLTLSLTADDPNMLIILPLYEVGALAALVVYYRKHMAWTFMLTLYFVVINIVGFIIALGAQ